MIVRSLAAVCLTSVLLAACAPSEEDVRMAASLSDQGKGLLAANKADEARDTYLAATARDGGNARAWNGLGAAQDILGKTAEAEQAYRKALAVDAGNLAAANNLSRLILSRGEVAEAIALLEPHAGQEAFLPPMRVNLAHAYALAGRDADADAILRGVLPADQIKRRRAAWHAERMAFESHAEVYADLGSYPTEAMAQGFVTRARAIGGNDAALWVFAVTPEVKIMGGTPVFSVRVTGAAPAEICDLYKAQAVPCVPVGK